MALSLLSLAPLIPTALDGRPTVVAWSWLPEWGLNFALRLDGLGLLFAVLILGIGLLIVLYATYYLPNTDRLGRFLAMLLAFAGGMLGIVLSENILLMVVFWEVTSITSFLLIAYKYEAHDARIAARMALAVTGGGGLALMAGFLLLGHIAGSYELTEILSRGAQIRAHPLYAPTLVLILLGAFTKSAQFPFHFWLPNAMAAPTPVSAYLHSATMVKAGVFLIARLYPALSGTDLWFALVSLVGAATFVYGAYVAMLKHDFKGLLAYSTISHLGLITLLFGLSTPLSAVAAVFHIINHAIFKASLFMAAGIIDHECGSRDMRRINGLHKYMPYTAALGIVAAGSMAGVPLLNGFLSKEMFFAEAVAHPAFGPFGWALPVFATVAGTLSVAYAARFIHDVFFNGEPVGLPRSPHEPPRWMRLPVEILVLLCVVVGVAPQYSVGPLLHTAAAAVLQNNLPNFTLQVWHGFSLPLVMSLVAFAAGIIYYVNRRLVFDLHERYLPHLHSTVAFERVYVLTTRAAARLMTACRGHSLPANLTLFLIFSVALTGWTYLSSDMGTIFGSLAPSPPPSLAVAVLVALALGSIGVVVYQRQRTFALILLGLIGLLVSMTFALLSAPDLALTQLSVEAVTIAALLLALRYFPAEARRDGSFRRNLRDLGIAVMAGGGIAALCYSMLTRPFQTISGFYLQKAVPEGGGSNVVNVILVDFRGFDTLFEITVLAMAGLGAHALLSRLRLVPQAGDARSETDRHPVMLAMLMRPLLPLALVVSFYILLRGHNLPGGGFIAGLITAVALVLQYVSQGADYSRARLPIDYPRAIAVGLAVAVLTGVASWLFGRPFLTSAHGHLHLPLIGDVPLASAMMFDLGVYIVVVASTLLLLTELGILNRQEMPRTAIRLRERQ